MSESTKVTNTVRSDMNTVYSYVLQYLKPKALMAGFRKSALISVKIEYG
jgi:hypothetical protein